jgi:hypothetical protein
MLAEGLWGKVRQSDARLEALTHQRQGLPALEASFLSSDIGIVRRGGRWPSAAYLLIGREDMAALEELTDAPGGVNHDASYKRLRAIERWVGFLA